MLVAFAVGAMILVSLSSMISGSMSISRKSNNSLIAYNAAAASLDLIGTDLESLAATSQPFEYLQIGNASVVTNGSNVARLMFLMSSANDISTNTSDSGQVRAVMYRLANQDVITANGSNSIYGLYRFCETNAGTVFRNYLGSTDLSTNSGFSADATNNDFLAGNIVDFQVRIYPPGSLTPINPNVTDVVRMSGAGITVGSTTNTNGVATAEVTLTVLEDRDNVMKRLAAGTLAITDAKRLYGHVLTRKVMLSLPR